MLKKRCPHLTSEEISALVDELHYNKKPTLPLCKLKHIWKCDKCEQQVVQVYHIRYNDHPPRPLDEKDNLTASSGDLL